MNVIIFNIFQIDEILILFFKELKEYKYLLYQIYLVKSILENDTQ